MVAGDAGDALAALAHPLAAEGGHELLIAALAEHAGALAEHAERLRALRAHLAERGGTVRVAAFTSSEPGADLVRLAAEEDIALLLMAAPAQLAATGVPDGAAAAVLAVALAFGPESGTGDAAAPVLVPFGGHGHDWAAIELGAWFARATGRRLQLAGAEADTGAGRRDASRLLGHASLALQRALGIDAEPVLAAPGPEGIVTAAQGAGLVVAGLSDRWAREGLGGTRLALARHAAAPVLLVRRGLRPGGLAPPRALTRFTWSVA
jgi:hypothetical protein